MQKSFSEPTETNDSSIVLQTNVINIILAKYNNIKAYLDTYLTSYPLHSAN